MKKGKSFSVDLSAIERFTKKVGDRVAFYDETMEKRTKAATRLVYNTARARRPYISAEQMKREGRTHRVSDPSAQLGVPVAAINGGRLQSSIHMKVERVGYAKFMGIVTAGGVEASYARYVEFGTSKMHARPFMRPAAAINRPAIKKLYNLNVAVNIN